ncbi:phosphodiester glycosidase family protein [Streptomyces sp. NPDC090025]|uniref:phosphodiester glycosidase family protein n=1 Tax=Streptomyces sp. NPDC090025 TaxID=3365922 RepID=UPI0038331C54
MTRNQRLLAALAAATAALTLTTSASAAPAAPTAVEPPSPLAAGWTQGTPVAQAPGVTRTVWTEKTPNNRPLGARVLQVVEIDTAVAPVVLGSTVGSDDASSQTVLDQLGTVSVVDARRPSVGVNGGLFQAERPIGTAEPRVVHTSATAVDGVLHSAACWERGKGSTGAVLQYGIPYITELATELRLTSSDGSSVRVDDINRNPGRVPHCERDAEDVMATDKPRVYKDADEVVVFTDDYGPETPKPYTDPAVPATADPGYEVVLDAHGVVLDAHPGRGGSTVPEGGRIVQGVGSGATWLREHLVRDDRAVLDQKLRDMTLGRDIPLDASVDVVSSFHRLLTAGSLPSPAPTNSCNDGTSVGNDGQPICTDSRTALATNIKGNTVLLTLTGGPGREDGDYLRDFATLIDSKELGLVDALNLDGGGSTTLVTGKETATPPTDPGPGGTDVHRKVADAVFAGTGGYGMYAKPPKTK